MGWLMPSLYQFLQIPQRLVVDLHLGNDLVVRHFCLRMLGNTLFFLTYVLLGYFFAKMEPACVAIFNKIRTICAHQLLDPTVKLA